MLTIPDPSICAGLRSTTVPPPAHQPPHPLLENFVRGQPLWRPSDHASVLHLHHPIVAALAPPL